MTDLHDIIFAGKILGKNGGDFTILEVVDGIAKSLTSSAAHYLYNPDKEITSETQEAFSIVTRTKLGLYVAGFDERYANVSGGLAFQGYDYFDCYTATGQWFKTDESRIKQKWYLRALDKILYNLTAFEDYHPALTGYLATETEIPINTVEEYPIGEVFDTGLTADNDIMIWRFYNGDIWLYKFAKGQAPVARISSNQYSFNVSGGHRTQLNNKVESIVFQQSALVYESTSGDIFLNISTVSEVFLAATFDVKNTDGEMVFAKNADIGDYI